MKRYVYLGVGIGLLVFIGAWLVYRTEVSLPASSASFGGVSLSLEYATTTSARELGLGGRTSLSEGAGMLFVFPVAALYGFWMKDTLIPLDIFWLDAKGRVVYMEENVATSSYPFVFYPPMPARYVLETNAGFAEAHAIATGTPLELKNFPSVSK